jgi:hypothetical protein
MDCRILGMYLISPQHAVVFGNVDQQPTTLDSDRSGTAALLEVLDRESSEAGARKSFSDSEFYSFVTHSSHSAPGGKVHVILNHTPAMEPRLASEYLQKHPGIHFHFLSSYGEWLQVLEALIGGIESGGGLIVKRLRDREAEGRPILWTLAGGTDESVRLLPLSIRNP